MPANKSKSKKKKWFLIIGSIVVILILLGVLLPKKKSEIPVQTVTVMRRNITQVVTATGKINPVTQVIITPEVTGEIVSLPVKEGDQVKKGQLLIKIKPDTYMAQRERASALLESSRANLKTKKVDVDFTRAELDRVQKLFKAGLANQQQLEKSQSDFSAAMAQYESLASSVSQAEASLKEANEYLNKTTIYSPMDGTVSQLNVKLGERVLGSGYAQGTNLMTVADLTQMEAVVEVDENDVVSLSVNDRVKIKIDAFKDRNFDGHVTHIGNSAKIKGEGTQEMVVNFEIKIALESKDTSVRPGMSCNADIETETRNNVLSLPLMSITTRSPEEMESRTPQAESDSENETQVAPKTKTHSKPQEIVFLVKNHTAKKKEVKSGISDDTYIEIMQGLKEGDIVVGGPYKAIANELQDGLKVVVTNESKSTKGGGSR
ncbi:MAG: efflux RND transporter periplasmic adaptor subunit [Candidatus Omnitrophota bacterium]